MIEKTIYTVFYKGLLLYGSFENPFTANLSHSEWNRLFQQGGITIRF